MMIYLYLFLFCSRDEERKPITEEQIKENRMLDQLSSTSLE